MKSASSLPLLGLIATLLLIGCEDRQTLKPGIFATQAPPAPFVFDQSLYNQQFIDPFLGIPKAVTLSDAYQAYAGYLADLQPCFMEAGVLDYACASTVPSIGLQQFLYFAAQSGNYSNLQSSNADQATALALNVAHAGALRDTLRRFRAGALAANAGTIYFATLPDAQGQMLQIGLQGFPAKDPAGPTLDELVATLFAAGDHNIAFALPSGDLNFAIRDYLMHRPYGYLPKSQSFVPLSGDLAMARNNALYGLAKRIEVQLKRTGKASMPTWLVAHEAQAIQSTLAGKKDDQGKALPAAQLESQAKQQLLATFTSLLVDRAKQRTLTWTQSGEHSLEVAATPVVAPPQPPTWRELMQVRAFCIVMGNDPKAGCVPVAAGLAKINDLMAIKDAANNHFRLERLLLEIYPATAADDQRATMQRATLLRTVLERLNNVMAPQVAVIQTVVLEAPGSWLSPLCDDEAYIDLLRDLDEPQHSCKNLPLLLAFDLVDNKLRFRFGVCENQVRSAEAMETFLAKVLE